jgi:steroid delta-isomerase-like uncharacterized protein
MNAIQRSTRERIVQEHIDTELRHELDALVATFTANCEWRDLASAETHNGRSGVRTFYDELFTGFPDFSFDVVGKHLADDAIVVEAVATGTHRGAWKGIPPTGRSVRFPLCAVFTFAEDDKIQAEIVYYDRLTVLAQLGVSS